MLSNATAGQTVQNAHAHTHTHTHEVIGTSIFTYHVISENPDLALANYAGLEHFNGLEYERMCALRSLYGSSIKADSF